MNIPVVFDMDGVLVDVRSSYRAAVIHIVNNCFADRVPPTSESEIDDLKLQGGYNDDWRLTEYLLLRAGVKISFEEVKQRFEEVFLGETLYRNFYGTSPVYHHVSSGFIDREIPLVTPEFIEKLSRQYTLALATGRNEQEAHYTLDKMGIESYFRTRVTMYEIPEDKRKPHPYSLVEAIRRLNIPSNDFPVCYYIGDIPDDIRAAVSARETFPFRAVGCLEAVGKPDYTRREMEVAGSDFIIQRTVDLEEVLKE